MKFENFLGLIKKHMSRMICVMLTIVMVLGVSEVGFANDDFRTYFDKKIQSTPTDHRLASVTIKIGQTRHKLFHGDSAYILPGQTAEVLEASLIGGGEVSYANVVGLTHTVEGKAKLDDLNVPFARPDMISKWAVSADSSTYKLEVKSGNYFSGGVFLKFVHPEIKYITVSVNGAQRILRDQDLLTVKGTDKFKVETIHSNIPDKRSIRYSISPLKKSDQAGSRNTTKFSYYEIYFLFEGHALLTIPMRVAKDAT